MEDVPEEAVIAAAKAIFEHSILAGQDPRTKAPQWLSDAAAYRAIARIALAAALPYLKIPQDGGGTT